KYCDLARQNQPSPFRGARAGWEVGRDPAAAGTARVRASRCNARRSPLLLANTPSKHGETRGGTCTRTPSGPPPAPLATLPGPKPTLASEVLRPRTTESTEHRSTVRIA